MQTIHLSGQDLPIAFGFGAIMQYEQATGRPILELFSSFQAGNAMFSDVVRLIACGLTNGSRKTGTNVVYTVEQVSDMLDACDNPMAIVGTCMEQLALSFTADEAKKKTVKMQPTARRKAV
jgi:Phage tail tube protein, GTA-gp10